MSATPVENKSEVGKNIASAIVGALISGLFAAHTSGVNADLEAEKIRMQAYTVELQREKDQLTSQLDNAKAAKGVVAELEQRRNKHLLDERSEQEKQKGKYWTVKVKNPCKEARDIAFLYESLDGLKVSEGGRISSQGRLNQRLKPPIRLYITRFVMGRKSILSKGTDTPFLRVERTLGSFILRMSRVVEAISSSKSISSSSLIGLKIRFS